MGQSERIRYPDVDTSSEVASMIVVEELIEEPATGRVENVMYVAVGKEVKESKSTLVWALHNSRGKTICIVHVHQPAQMIPMPMGGKFPVSAVGEHEVRAFREKERKEMSEKMDEYLHICQQAGVRAQKLCIENDSIEKGIVEFISQHRIGRLVMGAAADSRYSRKMIEPKSKKAIYIRQHAPSFCHIWFVCKGRLIYTREAIQRSSADNENRRSDSSGTNESDVLALPERLNQLRVLHSRGNSRGSVVSTASYDASMSGFEGSSDDFDQLSRLSLLNPRSPGSERTLNSPFSSVGGRESRLELSALCQVQENQHDSSPPSVSETSMNVEVYEQLEQAMVEAENSRREAFEESMRRRKAEREAIEAIRKVKTIENLYYEELRQRKEIEEELARGKEDFEKIKTEHDRILSELQIALNKKSSLERQIEESNGIVKDLEEKIVSAVGLLEMYNNEREELQVQRDNAVRVAEEMRRQLEGESSSEVPKFFSEFSFVEIEKATNGFHPSVKIGEGGYGNIYRGLLRHTEVAIKMPHLSSSQGPEEYNQEVDILSKLRHPYLVTLIGTCPESWAVIYEYLPNGSLEDRLVCKDNSPPLSWQTRIRIATELCSVLIFLHSSRPNIVIHGDLKPANVLLDANFICKLSDFGISRVVSNGEFSIENSTRFYNTYPKGTFAYMDPEFLQTGELTIKSDVYSFGVILLRLLTGKPARGIIKEVQYALETDSLNMLLDSSAGDWPFLQAKQLAYVALRCCDVNRKSRPDLGTEVWQVLEPMRRWCGGVVPVLMPGSEQAPSYFLCPIFQEIMKDPQIAADGYTYEAEAIRGWLDGGNDTSPITNLKLPHRSLIPNHALRSTILEWLQHRPCS